MHRYYSAYRVICGAPLIVRIFIGEIGYATGKIFKNE